jgi:hypothetical protein
MIQINSINRIVGVQFLAGPGIFFFFTMSRLTHGITHPVMDTEGCSL